MAKAKNGNGKTKSRRKGANAKSVAKGAKAAVKKNPTVPKPGRLGKKARLEGTKFGKFLDVLTSKGGTLEQLMKAAGSTSTGAIRQKIQRAQREFGLVVTRNPETDVYTAKKK